MYRKTFRVGLILFTTLVATVTMFPQHTNAVLWSEVDVAKRDLYNGAGGTRMRPNTRRVRFIRKETGGNNLKFRIRDARGHTWVAKIADESQAEVAANRLLYGVGYSTEIDYLVPSLNIPGRGRYKNVRLEARPVGVNRDGRWDWNENPFLETVEFRGLRVMMALINNWDLKDGNNAILRTAGQSQYVVSDLGSSFGKLPYSSAPLLNRFGRSVNDPVDFANSTFIRGVEANGEIDFFYKAKGKKLLKGITVDDARWIGNLLNQLSDRQIRDAFRAANYTPSQVTLLSRAVRERIKRLNELSGSFQAVR